MTTKEKTPAQKKLAKGLDRASKRLQKAEIRAGKIHGNADEIYKASMDKAMDVFQKVKALLYAEYEEAEKQ